MKFLNKKTEWQTYSQTSSFSDVHSCYSASSALLFMMSVWRLPSHVCLCEAPTSFLHAAVADLNHTASPSHALTRAARSEKAK